MLAYNSLHAVTLGKGLYASYASTYKLTMKVIVVKLYISFHASFSYFYACILGSKCKPRVVKL